MVQQKVLELDELSMDNVAYFEEIEMPIVHEDEAVEDEYEYYIQMKM
jgi:hypothetical protein